MRVTSQLPIQTTKIFYSILTCTWAPHFEKGSATHGHSLTHFTEGHYIRLTNEYEHFVCYFRSDKEATWWKISTSDLSKICHANAGFSVVLQLRSRRETDIFQKAHSSTGACDMWCVERIRTENFVSLKLHCCRLPDIKQDIAVYLAHNLRGICCIMHWSFARCFYCEYSDLKI